ncbi:hypothetical protein FQN54_004025 [Arachnomyces sp. PD_36]|nr:hypothetical protein FQN54_004025 [Arachnomyces sp. PD_36]
MGDEIEIRDVLEGEPEDGASSEEFSDEPNPSSIKKEAIIEACKAGNFDALVLHATSEGGLLEDELRKVAWPILLGCDSPSDDQISWRDLPRHGDEDQVGLDVNRSFVHYPKCRTEKELEIRKQELSDLITEVLRRHPFLCYFQGYHDIAQVLLLVLGAKDATPALEYVSLFRIRDYMLPSLSPALKHLRFLPSIIEACDPKLCRHISGTKPFFALAATLTLYAHDIQEYREITRLYDFLLAHEPVVAIYLFAAIILSRKKELLEIPLEEPEMLHFTLSKLPQPFDLEGLISSAILLYETKPPESLPSRPWRKISLYSVLKTSRDLFTKRSPEDAEELFEKQAQQLRREEFREKAISVAWRYRRPAGSVGLAIFIGVVSFWIRRNGSDLPLGGFLGVFKDVFRLFR